MRLTFSCSLLFLLLASSNQVEAANTTQRNIRTGVTAATAPETESVDGNDASIKVQRSLDAVERSALNARLPFKRSFEYCVEEEMTPEECQMAIQKQLAEQGEHEVGEDIVVKIHTPRTSIDFEESYWMAEVPVDVYGRVACDRNRGTISYPFLWEEEGGNFPVPEIDCYGIGGGECCMKVLATVKQRGDGYDAKGHCLTCFVHQEPLVPVRDYTLANNPTVFEDLTSYPDNSGDCVKVRLGSDEVLAQDEIKAEWRANALFLLETFEGNPTCEGNEFEDLVLALYDAAILVAPLSQKIGELACQFCYGTQDLEFSDPIFVSLLAQLKNDLVTIDPPSSTDKCVTIYTNPDRSRVVRVPTLGGGVAHGPNEAGVLEEESRINGPVDIELSCSNSIASCGSNQHCAFSLELGIYICKDYIQQGGLCGGDSVSGEEDICDPTDLYCEPNPFTSNFCTHGDFTIQNGGLCLPKAVQDGKSCTSDDECNSDRFSGGGRNEQFRAVCDASDNTCKFFLNKENQCCLSPNESIQCGKGLECSETRNNQCVLQVSDVCPDCGPRRHCEFEKTLNFMFFCAEFEPHLGDICGDFDGPGSAFRVCDPVDLYCGPNLMQDCNPERFFGNVICHPKSARDGQDCTSNEDCLSSLYIEREGDSFFEHLRPLCDDDGKCKILLDEGSCCSFSSIGARCKEGLVCSNESNTCVRDEI